MASHHIRINQDDDEIISVVLLGRVMTIRVRELMVQSYPTADHGQMYAGPQQVEIRGDIVFETRDGGAVKLVQDAVDAVVVPAQLADRGARRILLEE